MTFTPTPEQQAIIDKIRDEPSVSLMVDARAGAAKTSTIEMSLPGIQTAHSTLMVAFNKRIAEELQTRVPEGATHFNCATLNALGHRAWMTARGTRLTLDSDKLFTKLKEILPEEYAKQEDFFANVLAVTRKAKAHGLVPEGAKGAKKGLVPDTKGGWAELALAAGVFDFTPEELFWARSLLEASIKQSWQGIIDFDDQIYMSVLFGGVYPKYHTVIVDEAQDLSPLNHLQIMQMVGTRLIAVGDPYQAIYGFRGADSNSMTNLMDKITYERLGLTQSFRVPHKVSARQIEWVPDFGSMPFLRDGEVQRWPLNSIDTGDKPRVETSTYSNGWSIEEIPMDGFILCRNNAPLMKLAFTLIKHRRPVKILGRDIGASLAGTLDRICNKADLNIAQAMEALHAWVQVQLAKAGDSESKRDLVFDRKECLEVLLEASGATSTKQAIIFIKDLFAEKSDGLTLSSGHKAKGLEKYWVMHLDPFRIPSRQAERAADRGDFAPMAQERNLQYVIETRTKDTLVLADLDDCVEVEKR